MLPRHPFSRLPHRRFRRAASVLLAALGVAATTDAAVITVGAAPECTCSTIQCALDLADPSDAVDEIRLSGSYYGDQANQYTGYSNSTLTVVGGYADCASGTRADVTRVDGGGGAAKPVFDLIMFSKTSKLVLRHLQITGGDGSVGAGILFNGCGELEIADTTLSNNTADFGGGLAATEDHAFTNCIFGRVRLGANVLISNNTARQNGGGVFLSNARFAMINDNSSITFNHARGLVAGSGYGGGLYILRRLRLPRSLPEKGV